MILVVNPPKNVTVVPAVPAETINDVVEVDIVTISDDTVNEVKAVIRIGDVQKVYVLWDETTNPTYQQIGDWTQLQANNRILELL
jgi:hypothetical protein